MNEFVLEKAYAKVNFNLRILPKQLSGPLAGFHNIESIFQTIDLYDEVSVQLEDTGICSVYCDSMQLPEKNTITNAYEAFCLVAEVKVPGVKVILKKGIPSGGGLGGGSSDAAAFIRGLEKLCDIKLSECQLDFIADKTGSDVFFFMHCDSEGKGCALVSGRGEVIKKIQPRNDLFLLLIFPNFGSSTKEAYALVDEWMEKENHMTKGLDLMDLEEIYYKSPDQWTFENTFTPLLCEKYQELEYALGALKTTGAEFVDMSGSGSTCYGVYGLKEQALCGSKKLGAVWNSKVVQTI
ncbi:MAG: hypothetical protein MJ162_03040 [Treponema sp.]|nr:hypothetical protein [Treponema sp.]